MTELHYLDDLHEGQVFESASHLVEASHIKEFAREFDPQPFHLDEGEAENTLFRGLAASGWHTAAIVMRLLVDGGAPFSGGLIGAGAELEWPKATRPGDTIHVVSKIMEIKPSRSKPDRGIVVLRSEAFNQKDEVVQVLTSKLVVFRRTA